MKKKKRVLWFSRHTMSVDQYEALEKAFQGVHITQVSGDAANVHIPFEGKIPEDGGVIAHEVLLGPIKPLKELVKDYDEVAAVLPIGMQYQLLPLLPAGRLLVAKNGRELSDGGKVKWNFQKWEVITKIEIAISDL